MVYIDLEHQPERRQAKPKSRALPVIAGLFLLFVLSFFVATVVGVYMLLRPTAASAPVTLREAGPVVDADREEQEAIDLFKNCKDAVVNVDTVVFRRGLDMRVQAVQSETGSGFIWDDQGHIVTNFHVVKDATFNPNQLSLRIVLADRSEYKGSVIGVAPDVDLAVVKIDAPKEKLKTIALSKSERVQVGQKAYAIGNPFGLSLTLTKGIISALDREIESPSGRPISGAVQIDAPINPGNSGGPLLNKAGQLIGVNTSIATPSGGNVGIGFAIPVDTVNFTATELINNGRLLKPDMGIRLVEQRRIRRAGYTTGAMIGAIEPGSPADDAGLRALSTDPRTGETTAGDLIVKYNGKPVPGNVEFDQMLARGKPGEKVKLTIERGDKTLEVEVKLRGV